MNADREQLIAARAYQLWEEEGRPHGADQRHWEQASREIEATERKKPSARRRAMPAKLEPKAAAKAKPLKAKAKAAAEPKAKVAATPPRARSAGAKRGSADKPTIQ